MRKEDALLIAIIEIIDEEVFDQATSLDEAKKKWNKLKAHLKELGLSGIRNQLML